MSGDSIRLYGLGQRVPLHLRFSVCAVDILSEAGGMAVNFHTL